MGDVDVVAAGAFGDIGGDVVAGARVAHGECDIGAGASQRACGSIPMPEEAPVTIARRLDRLSPSTTWSVVLSASNLVAISVMVLLTVRVNP